MVTSAGSSRLGSLRQSLTAADPTAFLVESRVIRRLIRQRHSLAALSPSVPHALSQSATAEELLEMVHPDELGLTTFEHIPPSCILLAQPEDGELEQWPLEELRLKLWRRLFHAQVDRHFEQSTYANPLAFTQGRIAELGQVEFDEAVSVLRSEHALIHPGSRIEAYRELIAHYLELWFFAPALLETWFPSLVRVVDVEQIMLKDVPAKELFARSRIEGSALPDLASPAERDEGMLLQTQERWSLGGAIQQSNRAYLRLMRRRDRAAEKGNSVKAIHLALRAGQRATTVAKRLVAEQRAREEIATLIERLRTAVAFPDHDTEPWATALWQLAKNSIHGFWNADKRLLYDLQKVCLDHEKTTYKVDLIKWLVARGRRPLRRPLSNLREVAMAKHLASATSRLVYVRLSGVDRDRLTDLLERIASIAENQMRLRLGTVLRKTLDDVDLTPNTIPEQVGFNKLVEDALDCIAERGYLTMGYLRDSISRNDLKLPDLQHLRELWRGDRLLRADEKLDVNLDGVYRGGDFYLRWIQILSALFFATKTGRFATLFLIIPFGGALVIIEGVRHLFHLIAPDHAVAESPAEGTVGTPQAEELVDQIVSRQTDILSAVLILGFFLMALIHVRGFRERTIQFAKMTWKYAKEIFFAFPARLLQLPIVQQLFKLPAWQFLKNYLLIPLGIVFFFGQVAPRLFGVQPLNWGWLSLTTLLSSMLLNSRVGRDVQELTIEWVSNAWHQFRARLLITVIDWFVDLFRMLLSNLEKLLYAVDEWLRFRSDENWLVLGVKAVLGVVWTFFSFLIRIYVNLLIEPTFHPVKHFPVVTVAHKIFLPALIMLEGQMVHFLGQYLGVALARSITWFNIFFLPGFFGFAVWELKENWRLYRSNRRQALHPVSVGSHGETIARLMHPGFHSGTLPRLFRRLRKLEQRDASFRRFTHRRAIRQSMEHVNHAVHRFVDRELIHLLNLSPLWQSMPIRCSRVTSATNSIGIEMECPSLSSETFQMIIQAQTPWTVVEINRQGWVKYASFEQTCVIQHALLGFYRKCGIDLVREQLEQQFLNHHPYDFQDRDLVIWDSRDFQHECRLQIDQSNRLRLVPERNAAALGLKLVGPENFLFFMSSTDWQDWEATWSSTTDSQSAALPRNPSFSPPKIRLLAATTGNRP